MPKYRYVAKSGPGKIAQGILDAESELEVIQRLSKLGLFPISILAQGKVSSKGAFLQGSRVSRRDILVCTRHLYRLLASGIDILNAVTILIRQTPHAQLRLVLEDIAERIKNGSPLSEALTAHPHVFNAVYRSLILTGESSGDIIGALKRIEYFLEKDDEFFNSVRQSLTYPAFILMVSILMVGLLLTFVVPKLVGMFTEMGKVLPLPTRILIAISSIFSHYWLVLLLFCAGIYLFIIAFIRTPGGRIFWDKAVLRVSFVGPILLKTHISRLMRTLSILLSGGMPITVALDISLAMVDNRILQLELMKCKESITQGGSISAVLKKSALFPDFVTSIISIGEETGALEKAFMNVAEDYEKEVDRTLKEVMRLLEPAVILVMGLVVGYIVISLLLPIFQMNVVVQ